MAADPCIEALEQALARHERPDLFGAAQGSQLTSISFDAVSRAAEVALRMDGRGAWRDN